MRKGKRSSAERSSWRRRICSVPLGRMAGASSPSRRGDTLIDPILASLRSK